MKQTEKRSYGFREFRAAENDSGKIIEGHAAVFDQQTNIGNSFFEVIERGAFDGCDMSDVSLLVNHNSEAIPLATTKGGTLELSIDNIGLAIRAKLDVENNPDARALYFSIARGDLRAMSFAFSVDAEEWQNLESDMPTRRIKKFKKIFDCSITNQPAYTGTDISARSILKNTKEIRIMTFEEFVRQFKDVDERTARENISNGLMPDGKTAIPAEFRDMIPAKFFSFQVNRLEQPPQYMPGRGFIPMGEGRDRGLDSALEQREKAGKDLREWRKVESPFNAFGEKRTITVEPPQGSSANIVIPKYTSNQITPSFNTVSSLLDSVQRLELPGGESFQQPYVTGIDAGDYTAEGDNAAEAETHFKFANVNRCKLTAFAEITSELSKLPVATYSDVIFENIRTSMRQILAREILWGKGVENDQSRLVGIFSDKATAISANNDLSISQITDTTLDEIVFKYGGSEDVESPAMLIVSKLDLLAFSKVRTSTKQKFYDIQFNGGNSGTINGVGFIIDSYCKPLMSSDTVAGDYCMAYGNPKNYLLVEFSPLIVERSDDYKFRQSISAFKGSVFVGGNVVKHEGFLRVRKSAN